MLCRPRFFFLFRLLNAQVFIRRRSIKKVSRKWSCDPSDTLSPESLNSFPRMQFSPFVGWGQMTMMLGACRKWSTICLASRVWSPSLRRRWDIIKREISPCLARRLALFTPSPPPLHHWGGGGSNSTEFRVNNPATIIPTQHTGNSRTTQRCFLNMATLQTIHTKHQRWSTVLKAETSETAQILND